MIGANNLANYLGGGTVVNSVALGSSQNFAATDNAWNGVQGLQTTGGTAVINVNGAESGALTSSNLSFSASKILIGYSNGSQYQGQIAECGMLAAGTTSTQRGILYGNQHGASGYNGQV